MTQHSEDRVPDAAPVESTAPATARILPFERPQSDLQRAIQERVQETIERERAREREVRRPQPLKKIVILALAVVPVFLLFGAADSFLRAMRKFSETYSSQPAPPGPSVSGEATQALPAVIFVQPVEAPSAAPVERVPEAPLRAPVSKD